MSPDPTGFAFLIRTVASLLLVMVALVLCLAPILEPAPAPIAIEDTATEEVLLWPGVLELEQSTADFDLRAENLA